MDGRMAVLKSGCPLGGQALRSVVLSIAVAALLVGLCGCGSGEPADSEQFTRIATIPNALDSGGNMLGFSVDFSDAQHGWLGSRKLYQTEDGGRSWQPASGPIKGDASGVAVLPRDLRDGRGFGGVRCVGKDTIWLSYGAPTPEQGDYPDPRPMGWEGVSVLLVSRDAGRSWEYCSSLDLRGMSGAGMSWRDERQGWVKTWHAASDREYVFETKDGGRSWRRYPVRKGGATGSNTYDDVQTTSAPSLPNGFPWRPSTSEPGSLEIDWQAGGSPLHTTSSYIPEFGPVQGYIDDGAYEHLFGGIFFSDATHGWVEADNGVWATDDGGAHWGLAQRLPRRDDYGWGSFTRAGETVLLVRVDEDESRAPVIEVYARPLPKSGA